jgi:hypothetical protein
VLDKILGSERNSPAGNVRRAGANFSADRGQLTGNEVLARLAGNPQSDVVTLVGQINQSVADCQINGQVGISGHEVGQG